MVMDGWRVGVVVRVHVRVTVKCQKTWLLLTWWPSLLKALLYYPLDSFQISIEIVYCKFPIVFFLFFFFFSISLYLVTVSCFISWWVFKKLACRVVYPLLPGDQHLHLLALSPFQQVTFNQWLTLAHTWGMCYPPKLYTTDLN